MTRQEAEEFHKLLLACGVTEEQIFTEWLTGLINRLSEVLMENKEKEE